MPETLRGCRERVVTGLLRLHETFMMLPSFPVPRLGVNSAPFVEVTRPTGCISIFLSALASGVTKNNQGACACKPAFKRT